MTELLTMRGATLHRGGRVLFKDLNLSVGAGEAVQVRGPNGSGKSSLLRLAAGLLTAQSGRVERSKPALSDDSLALDPERSLTHALRFWAALSGTEADIASAMERLGIDRLALVPVRLLSSGQRKRASLARVLASGAPLWLLDEPCNALDADGRARLDSAIATHLAGGGAVLAASHFPLDGPWSNLELGR